MSSLIPDVDVPEGKIGNWEIKKITVKSDDFGFLLFNLRNPSRAMYPGNYTQLFHGPSLVMSDTPAERRDHVKAVLKARGRILINGLGLGMVLNACLLNPQVEHAIVVEKNREVIDLVAPHYQSKFGSRLQVEHADALIFKPPRQRFSMVWHDIWNDIRSDNLEQMKLLHRRYGRLTDWQGSWGRNLLR